jgi:hypothetical protein
MIDWAVAFSTASQAIKLGNELRMIDKQLSQADLKLKIVELNTALAELKMTLTEARAMPRRRMPRSVGLRSYSNGCPIRRSNSTGIDTESVRMDRAKKPATPSVMFAFKKGLLFETTNLNEAGRPLGCPNCKAKYFGVRTFTE